MSPERVVNVPGLLPLGLLHLLGHGPPDISQSQISIQVT